MQPCCSLSAVKTASRRCHAIINQAAVLSAPLICPFERQGSQAAPLRGCAAGHPHDVLAALVAALREVPQELTQGGDERSRVSA